MAVQGSLRGQKVVSGRIVAYPLDLTETRLIMYRDVSDVVLIGADFSTILFDSSFKIKAKFSIRQEAAKLADGFRAFLDCDIHCSSVSLIAPKG